MPFSDDFLDHWVPREGFRLALCRPTTPNHVVLDFEAELGKARRAGATEGEWVVAQRHGVGMELGQFLMARQSAEIKDELYRSMHMPSTLYRNFATMHPTPQSILRFANRYGLLGIGETALDDSAERSLSWYFESIAIWTKEVLRMNWAIQLWEALKKQDYDAVARIAGSQAREIRFLGPISYPRGTIERELIRKVRGVVQFELHFAMLSPAPSYGEVGSICLRHLVDAGMRDQIALRMMPDAETRQLHLKPLPMNLRGGLWLQLARAITANKEIRNCPNCGNFIDIVPPVTRRNRKYCSEACRSAAYRTRKSLKEESGLLDR